MKSPNDVKRPNSGGQSLGQFLRSRERLVHESVTYKRNPFALLAELAGEVFNGPKFVRARVSCYNVGRNAAKRYRRAAPAFELVPPSGRA